MAPAQQHAVFTRRTLWTLILIAGGGTLALLEGGLFFAVIPPLVVNLAVAALVLTAGGGYAWPIVRRLTPPEAPVALRIITAAGLGAWLLAGAVTCVGMALPHALTAWVWWPVVGGGAVLAAWWLRRASPEPQAARAVDGRALVWVALAVAAGFWAAMAIRPPGLTGVPGSDDAFDVLSVYLQLPRQWYDAQRVTVADLAQSPGPAMMQGLYLLAMTLQGGPYDAIYMAQLLHGAFGAMAVAALAFGASARREGMGRLGPVLLGVTPLTAYLGALARIEMPTVLGAALGLLWLKHWLESHRWRAAAGTALAIGPACAAHALGPVLVAAPVFGVMAVVGLLSPRRLGQVLAAAGLVGVLALPWCLPMAVGGRICPALAGVPDGATFFRELASDQTLGPIVKLLAVMAMLALPVTARGGARVWQLALAGVLVLQTVLAWSVGAPMAAMVAAAPAMVLLSAGLLSRLAGVWNNPFHRGAGRASASPWGLAPAAAIAAVALLVNLAVLKGLYDSATASTRWQAAPPVNGLTFAKNSPIYRFAWELPAGSRICLAGQAAPFYFPPGTAYAPPCRIGDLAGGPGAAQGEPLPLEMLVRGDSPGAVADALRRAGITHLWVERTRSGLPPARQRVLDDLLDPAKAAGMIDGLTLVRELNLAPRPKSVPASAAACLPVWAESAPAPVGPRVIIYALGG